MLTVDEIIERLLTQYDEDDILSLLEIDAEDLLNRFEDRITSRYDTIMEAIDESE